uniref:Bacterial membrane protein YfhO n=1 Tax=mine drainage metagenome TaxID=410659 RepID=E6Q726_9ZZZZ
MTKVLSRSSSLIYVCVSAILILATIVHFLLRPGVPAFQQDWLWPIRSSQIYSFATSTFFSWSSNGTGSVSLYPEAWLPNLVAGMCCWVFGTAFGIAAFVALILSVAAAGIGRLAKYLSSTPLAIVSAITLFLGSPVVLNELQAGHLYFLISYAAFPWLIILALTCKSYRDSVILGAAMGFGAAQQQFLFFDLLALIIYWLFSQHFRARFAIIATLVFLGSTSPQWILIVTQGATPLNTFLPLLHWERAESVSLPQAMRNLGYMAGYDSRLLPPLVAAGFWTLPFLGIMAAILQKRRATMALVLMTWFGIVMTSGLNGPLGDVIQLFFQHVREFALFRELYDFSALSAVGYACLAATLAGALRGRGLVIKGIVKGALAIAIAASCVTAAMSSYGIARAPSSLSFAIGHLHSHGYRFLPVPATFPQISNEGQTGGLSPVLLAVNGHPSAAYPYAAYPEAFIASEARRWAVDRTARLDRFGISELLPTAGIRGDEHSVVEPDLRSMVPEGRHSGLPLAKHIHGGGRLVVLPFSARPGTLMTDYSGARDIQAITATNFVDPNSLSKTPNPAYGWARTFFWPTLPRWSYAMPTGAFTFRNAAQLPAPAATITVGSRNGKPIGSPCRVLRQLDEYWRILRCGPSPTLYGVPPIVISQIALDASIPASIPMEGKAGTVRILTSKPTYVSASIRAVAGSAIVLRDAYNSSWKTNIPGTTHTVVDGYANAWVVSRDFHGIATFEFMPQRIYQIAIIVSLAILLVAVGLTVFSFLATDRDTPYIAS